MTKKRSHRFHLDVTCVIFLIIVIMTGQAMHYLIVLIMMIWHECGHFFMALYFKWPIKHMRLFIFGCVMETDAFLMRPIKEQWFVLAAGPIQHLFIFAVCVYLKTITNLDGLLTYAIQANLTLVCFNLLPIWPLDGGKMLYLGLNTLWPFRRSYRMTLIISFINLGLLCCFLIFIHRFSLSILLIVGFLFREIQLDLKDEPFTWYRFLLMRQSNSKTPPRLLHINQTDDVKMVLKQLSLNRETLFMIKETQKLISEKQMIDRYLNPVKYFVRTGDQYANTIHSHTTNRTITYRIGPRSDH